MRNQSMAPNNIARLAGLLYLLLVPLGIMGIIYVPANLIVPGDAVTTASNIVENEGLFRLSIFSALLVQLVNLAVVWALYLLLKPVNKTLAMMMVVFILLGVPIAMLNELNHFSVLYLLKGALNDTDYLGVFTPDQLQAQAMFFLDLHANGIIIAQVFWGLWLLPMGYLIIKSGFLPKLLGFLLIIGGIGYLVDVVLIFLFPEVELVFSEFTFLGEVLLPLWLLIKGVKVGVWTEQALAPA